MREHEVPTHVQAEDKVLLWFTFPQIVALTAVCALSYGAYSYAPVGPAEARMAIAVVLGLAGVAAVVGKIGGRRLPLVAADLLRFWLGARRYAGPPAQLVRGLPDGKAGEPPAPVQSVPDDEAGKAGGPGPLRLMARRARRVLRRRPRDNKKRRKEGERRNWRMPLRWFGKRRRRKGGEGNNSNAPVRKAGGNRAATREAGHRKSWLAVLAATALAILTLTVPQSALADGHWPGQIEYEIPEPVPGRRIFVEGLQVSGDRAKVTLRAATDLHLRVRAYGGREGRSLRFWGSASLDEGERTVYSVPLSGESPSLTFSWEDGLGQAGAATLKDGQIPYPLPSAEGELCRLSVASLGWTLGSIEGTVASECVAEIEEAISLQTVAGHKSVTETAVMEAAVAAITGTVSVAVGGSRTSASFVPNGETRFSIPVATGKAVHGVAIEAELEAALRIAMPPMIRLTHHPERTEHRTETVRLVRPGTSETVHLGLIPAEQAARTLEWQKVLRSLPAGVVGQGLQGLAPPVPGRRPGPGADPSLLLRILQAGQGHPGPVPIHHRHAPHHPGRRHSAGLHVPGNGGTGRGRPGGRVPAESRRFGHTGAGQPAPGEAQGGVGRR